MGDLRKIVVVNSRTRRYLRHEKDVVLYTPVSGCEKYQMISIDAVNGKSGRISRLSNNFLFVYAKAVNATVEDSGGDVESKVPLLPVVSHGGAVWAEKMTSKNRKRQLYVKMSDLELTEELKNSYMRLLMVSTDGQELGGLKKNPDVQIHSILNYVDHAWPKKMEKPHQFDVQPVAAKAWAKNEIARWLDGTWFNPRQLDVFQWNA